jgi:hypothetical protein
LLLAVVVLLVPATAQAEAWKDVEAGLSNSCGILDDDTVHCWGLVDGRPIPAGGFKQLSAGNSATCGIALAGTMACWGSDYQGEGTPLDPTWTWSEVSVGYLHSCGMRTDGALWCWGSNTYGARNPIPGDYTHVSVNAYHSCGIRTDATIVCWGTQKSTQYCEQPACQPAVAPPTGSFTQIAAGFEHTCALRTTGEIACWGTTDNRSVPPTGTFSQVDAGDSHTCAIRTEGTVACWGDDVFGQSTPLSGTFKKVSAGAGNTCGVRTDSTVVCWGSDDNGESTPRTGPDVTRPVLSALRLTNTRFRAAKRSEPHEVVRGRGTTIRFTLSEAAVVKFTFLARGRGRLVGGACRKRTPGNQANARCDLKVHGETETDGHRATTTDPGHNSYRWNGRYWRRYPTANETETAGFDETRLVSSLAPGRYWLVATPRDRANKGVPVKVAFTVLR